MSRIFQPGSGGCDRPAPGDGIADLRRSSLEDLRVGCGAERRVDGREGEPQADEERDREDLLVVEAGALATTVLSILDPSTLGWFVTVWLWLTVVFGTLAESVAEGRGKPEDVELLASIAHGIAGNSICALGDAAAWPMLGFLTKYRADFEAAVRRKGAAA